MKHLANLFCEIYDVRPSATKTDFFRKIPRSKKALSMWDGCRFNLLARKPLISSNKVVTSTSSSNKALIITFMLKNGH